MDAIEQFKQERNQAIAEMAKDEELKKKSLDWMIHADKYKYTYNYSWLGRPVIKYPTDLMLLQEIIWDIKPDLIVETGIAHGGSIIFSASMMELLGGDGMVVAVDIDIRQHNRKEIEKHPLFKRITMLEGSSTDPIIVQKIREYASEKKCVMVSLDSLHTHDHVLQELRLYSPLVTVGSYLILPDTLIEFFPKGYYSDRPWDVGNNTMTALREFLKETDAFIQDKEREGKLCITEGIDGYLKRIK
jgi:cephalosporin hydroxylase